MIVGRRGGVQIGWAGQAPGVLIPIGIAGPPLRHFHRIAIRT